MSGNASITEDPIRMVEEHGLWPLLLIAYQRGRDDQLADLVEQIGGRIFPDCPSEFELHRWKLRGEPRSRKTFGQPHPDDYPGGAAA